MPTKGGASFRFQIRKALHGGFWLGVHAGMGASQHVENPKNKDYVAYGGSALRRDASCNCMSPVQLRKETRQCSECYLKVHAMYCFSLYSTLKLVAPVHVVTNSNKDKGLDTMGKRPDFM